MPENGTVEILPEKAERHCGDTVFLIAKPQHIFSCWQPNDVFEHPLDLTLKKDMDITAVFELEDKLSKYQFQSQSHWNLRKCMRP